MSHKWWLIVLNSALILYLVVCVDDLGQNREPGEKWEVEGMFGMTCDCLSNGEVDCDFGSSFDFSNYMNYF